ncbi:MAG TPA: hypothetical protein ENN34_12405 [Deltaproteobacteria bacterium]|nr:hypothetical protein [Deltaproteobacteria bacterium]
MVNTSVKDTIPPGTAFFRWRCFLEDPGMKPEQTGNQDKRAITLLNCWWAAQDLNL